MVYIYEDEGRRDLLPLTLLKPVFELRCGAFTFKERVERVYPGEKIQEFRVQSSEFKGSKGLFINGRALLWEKLPEKEGVFVSKDEIVGVRVQSSEFRVQSLKELLKSVSEKAEKIEVKARVVKYPWDLIRWNGEAIIKDIELLQGAGCTGSPGRVQGARDLAGVYFIEEGGPIYIEDDVKIRPPTIIEGPCYIGKSSLIDGAKIRPGVSIGKGCKIAGEVEESIFSDFSNKHHSGFIGHAYVGEWVNLGALTTNSDLKNTYGTVKVPVGGKEIDTGLLKIGSFIGDHTKTGIGTLLTTGCVIGCFANIYGGGVFPKYVPSFVWGTREKFVEYDLEKAIAVARKVMGRRDVELTQEYEERIREVFKLTRSERKGI